MGKVRVKTFGSPEEEAEEQKKAKEKKEQKKMAKGAHGGERVVSLGVTEEEIRAQLSGLGDQSSDSSQSESQPSGQLKTGEQTAENGKQKTDNRKKKAKFAKKKVRSQRYQDSMISLDKDKTYSLKEALELLSKFQKTKFDETIELHINTIRSGISGNITLPHGSGKTTRVAVADDALIAEIETGKINFDILVAEPSMMPKLAKVAKVLGPRGLMPNPKNGTITAKPEEVVRKFEAGQMSYKTEAKAPIIHMVVGKFSFGGDKLSENIKTAVGAIKSENISKITLKSTMSPGIKIQI